MRFPALAFYFSYTSSVINITLNSHIVRGIRFHLRTQLTKFADSTNSCVFHLHLRNPEQLAIFACCGIRGTMNMLIKITLQVFARRVHGSFVCRINLHFGTCLWKGLSRDSRNKNTPNCAPIQCTVWPRNEINLEITLTYTN